MRAKPVELLSLISLAGLLALGALIYVVWPDASTPLPDGHAKVIEVIDGDTIKVLINGTEENIRFLGIDTPETHHPTKPVECYGQEASDRLSGLLPKGQTVRLERDREARDHYNRILAYVYLPGDPDDVHLNLLMVAEGYAVTLPIDPNRAYRSELAAAEQSAKAQNLGLWGFCGGPGVALNPLTSWRQP